MKIHKLKYKSKYLCDAVYDGRKSYEIRYNDRNYEVGDQVYPIPIDDNLNTIEHPIAKCVYEITFISEDVSGLQPGYCVFGVRRII